LQYSGFVQLENAGRIPITNVMGPG